MKEYIKRLFSDAHFLGAVVTGTVAALVAAGVVAPWATLIAVAAFAPVTDTIVPKRRKPPVG